MGITVRWYDDQQTAILYDVTDRWNWTDVADSIQEAIRLLDSVDHAVHLLVDVRSSTTIPPLNPSGLQRVANAPTMNHPNTGLVILIGPGPLIKILFDMFSRIYPRTAVLYQVVPTMEEAEALMTAQ